MLPDSLNCFLVRQLGKDRVEAGVETRPLRELPEGDVLIRVQRSSLNYKDAMAAQGHPGIVRKFPHVPGIDAAGTVAASSSPAFKVGDNVFSTGHELGVERWGGWAEYVRVPAAWVLSLPAGTNVDEIMALGTAGFTAAQCVASLQQHGVSPDKGEILVTGATGGVASLAIAILSRLGYRVAAVSGKPTQHEWLRQLGAGKVLSREELQHAPSRPLLAATYAGAVDTVGGAMLSQVLKLMQHRGCVTCCGVAGGAEVQTTVYPFILRGVTLAGIDSAWCPDDLRPALWEKLTGPWKPLRLLDMVQTVPLREAGKVAQEMLRGKTRGRTLIDTTD